MKDLKIATFDIESYDWIYPICLSFYDGINYKLFYSENCISEFVDYLFANPQYRGYRIFAHYGGRFDFLFILDEFYKRGLLTECNFILIDGNVAKLSYNKYNFVDSKHLLLNSLDKLTKVFKTSHKKLHDIDRDNILKYSKKTIKKYVRNDTIGLFEVMELFYKEIYNIFSIYPALTIASTTMNAFRNQNKQQIYPINNDKLDIFIRNCYYGGRVEIFNVYGNGLYYYDFNSLYPAVMMNNKFPIGNYIKLGDNDFYEYLKPNSKYLGYGKFKIKTPNDLDIPLLPTKYNEKLLFPLGQFIGYYSFNEIKKALEIGYEVELIEGYISRYTNNLFNDYITKLYKEKLRAKENNDSAKYLIYKIMANSLYGKFGESKERDKYTFKITEEMIINNECKKCQFYKKESYKCIDCDFSESAYKTYSENPPIYIYEERLNKPYHNVGIAVEVTTYARLKLYNEMEKIIKKGYEIYYIDTDSIITNCPPYELNVSDSELGLLKLEDTKNSKGEKYKLENFEGLFIAPKFYAIKVKDVSIFKHKGFKSINLTFNQLKELHFNQQLHKIAYNATSINKLKESLKRVHTIDRRSRFLSTKPVKKSIKSRYDKRFVIGNSTKPLKINCLDSTQFNFNELL